MLYLSILYPLFDLYSSYKSLNDPHSFCNNAIRVKDITGGHEYDKKITNICANTLKAHPELLNIHFFAHHYDGIPGGAEGCMLFKSQKKFVIVNSCLMKIDERAVGFTAKHEIGHILHNDTLKTPASLLICSIAMSIIFPSIGLKGIRGLGVSLVSLFLIDNVYHSKIQEAQADAFSIKSCSLEELQGALCLFTAGQESEEHFKKKFPLLNVFYNFLFACTHPSPNQRIAKIQAAYLERAGKNYTLTNDDRSKIEEMKRDVFLCK